MEFGTMRAGRGDDGTRIVYETKKRELTQIHTQTLHLTTLFNKWIVDPVLHVTLTKKEEVLEHGVCMRADQPSSWSSENSLTTLRSHLKTAGRQIIDGHVTAVLPHSLLNLEESEKGLNEEPCSGYLSSEPQETHELGGKDLGCSAGRAFYDIQHAMGAESERGKSRGRWLTSPVGHAVIGARLFDAEC